MPSTYKSTSTLTNVHAQPHRDDLGLNNYLPNAPYDSSHLSPFNHSQQPLSNSASPSYNVSSTPGESVSDLSYQPSEFSELDDEFFGVDFDAGVHRIDSLPSNLPPQAAYRVPQEQHPLATTINSTYPLSPKLTSIPNTPSPRASANDLKAPPAIPHYEQKSHQIHSHFQPFTPQVNTHPTTIELTPDRSGSSEASGEGLEASTMDHHGQDYTSASPWETQQTQVPKGSTQSGGQYGSTQFASHPPSYNLQTSGVRDEEEAWIANERTGQGGLNPEARHTIADIYVPNHKDREENALREAKRNEVEAWRSQAGSEAGDEPPATSYFDFDNDNWHPSANEDRQRAIPNDENNIAPVDDTLSIHENQLVEGQTYYNLGAAPTPADFKHMAQSRHWSDAPMIPKVLLSDFQQEETANAAMKRYNDNSDAISLQSRVATWGTRRRSEPNLAEFEGITDGSFFKKLSIKSKDANRNRSDSILQQGLNRLASALPSRRDSKLKRNRSAQNIAEEAEEQSDPRHSQSSQRYDHGLVPPSRTSFSRGATPSVNTAFAAMTGPLTAVGATHARSGSVTVAANNTSPKSPTSSTHLGWGQRVVNRARSRSELSTHERSQKTAQSGIVGQWKNLGGPPVANLASPPLDEPKQKREAADFEDDEEDEEDQVDDGEMKVETEQQEPIVPNYEGFKAHVRRLNPDILPRHSWLISRIAHQQEIRYKNLLDLRVKHSQAMGSRSCTAGKLCAIFGGHATLLDPKGNPRVAEGNFHDLQIQTNFSDDDSNPGDGAVTDDTFPAGVPMPPSRNLPAEFECQLCFKVKKFQKPSDWTKHVHEDVQPFTCTYDKCKEPKSFKRKADWVRHENERHRQLERWVCEVDDCRHICYRKDNFLQHLVREHKLPEPKQKTKAAIKKARLTEQAWIVLDRSHHETIKKPQEEACKFCGKTFNTWKKLTVHLAKHMEQISLPILRLVEQKHVDANTIISPVREQILTPITPSRMDGNSPFNMNSVSPHVPVPSHFTSRFEQPSYYPTTSGSMNYDIQAHIPQAGNYDQSLMYPMPYSMQQMAHQPRAFNAIPASNLTNMSHNRNFGSMDSNFSHVKVEQQRAFGPVESTFSHNLPNQGYPQHNASYTIPNEYVSNAPTVSGFQAPNMLGISGPEFGYDQMGVQPGHNFHTPMSRAQGSASSYGQSPQNLPPNLPQNSPYYGHR